MQTKQEREMILNTRVKDSGSKLIFHDNVLCTQFLNKYVNLPYLKNVKPEDIEDVSEQFVTLFENERNADTVKKIHLANDMSFYLISLIEHKTQVDYNVSMQIFRYMVFIWDGYEREMERQHAGITKTAGFQYPPIIPIVYYEGKENWTAPMDFQSKITNGELFGKYIPDFRYYLVPIHKYGKEELLEQGEEISLVMLINRMQTKEDVDEFRSLSPERIDAILAETPEYRRNIIADILKTFLLKVNIPVEEAEALTSKVKEKKMAELFGNIDDMNFNVELERQRSAEKLARAKAEAAEMVKEAAKEAAKEATKEVVEEAIRILVESCQEFNATKEATVAKVSEKFHLESAEAEDKVQLYWKG